MAQHFLLSAAARTLSLRSIYKDGEEAAYAKFCEMRWPETNGEAICPDCGCCETYKITTRHKFKCKGCYRQFSVTSGTIFASRKMAFVDLLAAICITVNASKGVSMVQLSRDLDCQYKTAFALACKLREAMAREVHTGEVLTGHVEIDGAYFGGTIRPENHKANRKDRRLKENQNGQRRVVVVMRERLGRTLPIVTMQRPKAWHWCMRMLTVCLPCRLTKHRTAICCMRAGRLIGLTTAFPTATTASTPTGLKAISRACVGWSLASTTT